MPFTALYLVTVGARAITTINDIIHQALSSAKIPSRLEPSGLYRSDGKRPDGITIVPWRRGKLLVWDTTCPDTYAPSYSTLATIEAGAVAARDEAGKRLIYSHLDPNHLFELVTIETSGAFGPSTMEFLEELSSRLNRVVGDADARSYLYQRLSMAVQRGNVAQLWVPSALHLLQISFF